MLRYLHETNATSADAQPRDAKMFSFTRGQSVSGIVYNGKERSGVVEDIIAGGKSIVLKLAQPGEDGKTHKTMTIAKITKVSNQLDEVY